MGEWQLEQGTSEGKTSLWVARLLPWRAVEWRFLGNGVISVRLNGVYFTFSEERAQERVFGQIREDFGGL